MDPWGALLQITLLLGAAMALGVAFERLGQSAILGYLLAGTLLGPGAMGLVHSEEAMHSLSELGVALLLFTIGLEFSWRRMKRLGRVAMLGGVIQIVATMAAAALICMALGMGWRMAVAAGAIIAPSSTACVLRVLTDRAEVDSIHGRNALGVLLLQDVAIVPMVLILTMLGGEGTPRQAFLDFGKSVGFTLVMVGVFFELSNHVLPRLLDAAALSKNRELPILLAVVTFLLSAWGAHALELSPALGAFIAGMLIAESPYATQIRADVGALRTLFVTLFFAAMGMLANLSWVAVHLPLLLGVALAVIVGKAAVIWPIMRAFGVPHRHAVATGVTLAQVGEFSFVLAGSALALGLLTPGGFGLIVSTAIVTLFATPFFVNSAMTIGHAVERRLIDLKWISATPDTSPRDRAHLHEGHVILVGLGPAGHGVLELLRRSEITVVVVELNPRPVAAARAGGINAVIGDASQPAILDHLNAPAAAAVVITLPDQRVVTRMIQAVRAVAPRAPIVARSRYHMFTRELHEAGATVVVDEEEETGRLLGRELLRLLDTPADWAPEMRESVTVGEDVED